MKFRPFQTKFKNDILNDWKTHRNVLAVLPTGGGKTVVLSNIVAEHVGASCVIAHRQELVSQISLALSRDGVRHKIIAPQAVVKNCVKLQMQEHGKSYYDPNSRCSVAGVDTLVRRGADNSVSLWVQDEAHHVLRDNKWGTAATLFPNAKGLGVTATPIRADGKGLGIHADGLFHTMVEGPTMRTLIDSGYLTDYRIFAPTSHIDLSDVNISAGGDYNPKKLAGAVRKSKVVGDVVHSYKQFAMGEAGITFATDVETANDIADQFNASGIPAMAVSAKTPDAERMKYMKQLINGDLLQVVNVDLFGEGVDVPAVKVVSFARPTQSYGLFKQQCGRVLRLFNPPVNWDEFSDIERLIQIRNSKKPHGKIIDHVGNILERHGLPDLEREWSLDAVEKRSSKPKDEVPIRVCTECMAVYERIKSQCPFCMTRPVPGRRDGIEYVDGVVTELDASTLMRMRGAVERMDMDVNDYTDELIRKNCPQIGIMAHSKKHMANQAAQEILRDSIAQWAGYRRAEGMPDEEIYKTFYFKFQIDIMSAQALKEKDAKMLDSLVNTA